MGMWRLQSQKVSKLNLSKTGKTFLTINSNENLAIDLLLKIIWGDCRFTTDEATNYTSKKESLKFIDNKYIGIADFENYYIEYELKRI